MLTSLRRYTINLSIGHLQRSLLLGSIGLSLIFVMANLILSWPWLNQPFAGFLYRNGVVSESRLPGWPAQDTALEAGDVVLLVDGQPLSPARWPGYLHQQPPGRPVTYTLLNKDGQTVKITLPLALFMARDFIQLVVAPILIAVIALLTAGVVAYFRSDLLTAKLFCLFSLAMVYFSASLPDFVMGRLFPLNFVGAAVGGILMPPLLLHFLFLFPYPRKMVQTWPFLLPVIYLPVLPALIYLPTLIDQPQVIRLFDRMVYMYMAGYTVVGLILLLEAVVRTPDPLTRKQALTLLVGLTLPTGLFIFNALLVDPIDDVPIHQILERYAFIGVPIAAALAIIRYGMFKIDRTSRWHVPYLEIIGIILAGHILLVLTISPVATDLSWLRLEDLSLILYTIVAAVILRPLYRSSRRWFEQRFWGNVEDFRAGLRIFSHELLKIKSRHDLEALISWDIPADFKLRNAELSSSNIPSSPYALRLPLSVSNVPLGTLFFGAKIDHQGFTTPERAVFAELQKQVSLALWSFELDKAIQTTEELTRLKSKFLANVTHELRTPLNGIINYIGFVLDGDVGPLNEEQADHLKRALHSAEKLLEVINNILDMSKIEAGQMTLNLQPVNLAELVTELIPTVQEMLNNKPVTIISEVSPQLPLVWADRLRLRQIMMNLFSNAAKFTDTGVIRLNVYPENGQIIIRINDTGRGIEETFLPTIFQQFASTSLIDANQFLGPGLGLPITRSLVELHGGQIEVESRIGQGTTFTVLLPINAPDRIN